MIHTLPRLFSIFFFLFITTACVEAVFDKFDESELVFRCREISDCSDGYTCLDGSCPQTDSCDKTCQPVVKNFKDDSPVPSHQTLAELTKSGFETLCQAYDANLTDKMSHEMRCGIYADTTSSNACDEFMTRCTNDTLRDPPPVCARLNALDFAGCTADANIELLNSCMLEFVNATVEFYQNFSCESAVSGKWMMSYSFEPSPKCRDELFIACITSGRRANPFYEPLLP